jgi:ABC-2 type transport system ATP-binding protein
MIEFDTISKRYGTTLVVDNLSLEIARGETLALIGPNGAGKTTLMRVLLGLARPTEGQVRVAGHDVQRDGIAARSQIGYLPQRAVLYANLTVAENLAFLAQIRDVAPERVAETIALLRLEESADRPARTLSGGMLQRLGLAQALLADPPILVLDEPTVSLDPPSVAAFKVLLRDLHAAGKTVLLASHILGDVEELADRVAILDQGRLIALDSMAGLARRCALPERLRIDLEVVTGREAEVARCAGASAAEIYGSTLHIAVQRERKLMVIQALVESGAAIRDFYSQSPSLEAIFARLINHAPTTDPSAEFTLERSEGLRAGDRRLTTDDKGTKARDRWSVVGGWWS